MKMNDENRALLAQIDLCLLAWACSIKSIVCSIWTKFMLDQGRQLP